jgi:hypothetical protein
VPNEWHFFSPHLFSLPLIMTSFLTLLFWCFLLLICWPLAILVLLLWPVLWLLSIPFRIVGVLLEALLAFMRAVMFLPARILGWRGNR